MWPLSGLSIFLKCNGTSLFTGCTFYFKCNIFDDYLMQQSLKLGGTNYHFKWINVPGTAPSWKACLCRGLSYLCRELSYLVEDYITFVEDYSTFVDDYNTFVENYNTFVEDYPFFVETILPCRGLSYLIENYPTFVEDYPIFVEDYPTFIKDYPTCRGLSYFVKD